MTNNSMTIRISAEKSERELPRFHTGLDLVFGVRRLVLQQGGSDEFAAVLVFGVEGLGDEVGIEAEPG